MGYKERNLYAINDLNKLIIYKTKRGISLKWQSKAYSYLNAFRRRCQIPTISLPSGLCEVDVSIKSSNLTICRELGITHKIAEKLALQTLRLDAEQKRKRRYNSTQGRSSRWGYLINCEHHFIQQREIIEDLLQTGMTKTAIAKKLGISRKHVYQLLARQKVGSLNDNKTK